MTLDQFSRRQIIFLSESALQQAGVVDVLPTPLDVVAGGAGVSEIISIGELPEDLAIRKPPGWKRILGAYLYRSDTAFVDLSQPVGRRRFTLAHETGHKLIPWHADSFHLDNDARIFEDTEEELEEEATLAGTLLIFQGGRFHTRALDYETGLQVPITLADTYGASITATARFYVEHHPDPVGLVIAGRFERADGTVPIWATVASKSFRERFGGLDRYFPQGSLPVAASFDHAVPRLVRQALATSAVQEIDLAVTDINNDRSMCLAQSFFNRRCVFFMISPKSRLRRGRRLGINAS